MLQKTDREESGGFLEVESAGSWVYSAAHEGFVNDDLVSEIMIQYLGLSKTRPFVGRKQG